MNLVKELHKVAEKNYLSKKKEMGDILDSVNASLQEENDKDTELLRYFGTKKVIEQAKTSKRSLEVIKNKGMLLEEDIEKVANNYALRFLPASQYKKEIPLKVLNDLRNFTEENPVGRYNLQDKLFIMAPHTHFTLGPKPSKDPVLFYKPDPLEGQYQIVSQWGSDFTFLRRLFGFFKSNTTVRVLCLAIVQIILAKFIVSLNIDQSTDRTTILIAGMFLMSSMLGLPFVFSSQHEYKKNHK